mmetsp:Transcript_19325/g.41048  ORF Transcript_19325/g.41048 Transcript_19325/m.41048 type:complete len:223 (-) Transcript_19325:917-1585(-)
MSTADTAGQNSSGGKRRGVSTTALPTKTPPWLVCWPFDRKRCPTVSFRSTRPPSARKVPNMPSSPTEARTTASARLPGSALYTAEGVAGGRTRSMRMNSASSAFVFEASTAAMSPPKKSSPEPSTCGLSTHESGSSEAAFRQTFASAESPPGSPIRAKVRASAAALSGARKRCKHAGSQRSCCTFFMPASCAGAEGHFTASETSMASRAAQQASAGEKCPGQ